MKTHQMLRRILLMLFVPCAGLGAANAAATPYYKVVLEDDSVFLFDSDADAESFDIQHCFNAVVDSKGLKKLRRILNRGRNPSLTVTVLEKYFDRSIWNPYTSGHYIYKGREVRDLCQREDLVVINSVEEDQSRK